MNRFVAVVLALTLAGCSKGDGNEADALQGANGKAAPASLSRTHHAAATELFVEFPALVQGEQAAFAAHITRLSDFSALSEGEVTVVLGGGDSPEEAGRASVSANPGIYRPLLTPRHAGKRRLAFKVSAPGIDEVHEVGEVTVYAGAKDALADAGSPAADAGIRFTKEQQWKIPFGTAPVTARRVRESIGVNATLRPRPAGEAHIAAPGTGLLRAGPKAFPQIGMDVQAGQIVAYLLPRMGGATDAAALQLAVQRARIETQHARHDRERIEGLFAIEAVPERRLREARAREEVARAELTAAERRAATYAGAAGGIALKSPIAGTVVAVNGSPGGAVTEGTTVVQVADLSRMWLEAKVPEGEITRVASPAGAYFRAGEADQFTMLEVGRNARLVASGGLVDRETRTVPVIFDFENRGRRLRAGMSVQAHIYTGRALTAPAVPVSALVDDGGQSVVYVQKAGESFERRVVQPGAREGEWVGITRGLSAGERIVTRGAYDVRLSAAAPATAGEGHVH